MGGVGITVAHDAIEQSLSEHNRALEQQVRDLQAILGHLLASINETRDAVGANGAKIDRCMAAAASATARAELAIVKAQESVTAAAILERVADEDAKPRHAEPKPKRKCKLPPGWGGVVAGAAIALGLLKAHRAAAIAGAGALMVAASAPMAASMMPDTDAHLVTPVSHHHFHAHRDLDPVTGAILPPRRRNGSPVKAVHRKRAPSPKGPAATHAATPPPSPVPSPTGSTMPQPSPAATPPVPTPTPTVTGILVSAWDH